MLQKLLILLTILIVAIKPMSAQNKNDYSASWKKIEGLEKKGLTKSALDEARLVFKDAVAKSNEEQQIKAAMFQMKYRNLVEEDNAVKNLFFLDTLVSAATSPAKNILLSMQAEILLNYRQNNRYKLYSRTALLNEDSKDVNTWSLAKLNSVITDLYQRSLSNDAILKSISLSKFENILERGINTRDLRPTAYDLLAFRALEYFTNTENDINNPAYKFILTDEKLFAPVNEFVQLKFQTKDTASLYFNAIELMQDILKFHLNDKNTEALLDADLQRYQFIYQHGVFYNKQALYEQSLLKVEKYYSSLMVAQAIYLRAALYYEKGQTFKAGSDTTNQFATAKAKELCELIISKYPKSTGAINAQNLVTQIVHTDLKLATEKVNLVNSPFKTLIQYKNLNQLYLRVIKLTRDQLEKTDLQNYDKRWADLVKMPVTKEWSVQLPNANDYQEHGVEIKIDALIPGFYIILASKEKSFDLSNNIVARQETYVSNISYVINNGKDLYVIDRDKGTPLKGARVSTWHNVYNNIRRRYENVLKQSYTSNDNGYVGLVESKENSNISIQVNYNKDELFTDDNFYLYNSNEDVKKAYKRAFLFTDRSIYRPGQKVFFKGILLSTDATGRQSTAVENLKSSVNLFDANGQKIKSLQLTTNGFGSYNGSFDLPTSGLNGQFFIHDSITGTNQYFNVEEYKRPTYSVEVMKPSGTYIVNDSIKVTGHVKGYAGNNIDGAQVKYRVVRKVQYPIWFGWGRKYFPPFSREEMEITNGINSTDANGDFVISFKAIPDETADKKNQPTFNYEVSADVTDQNGETRSGTVNVAVAYQAIQLDILTPAKIAADSLKTFKIGSNNSNNIFEKVTATVSLYEIKPGSLLKRERLWDAPDKFIITKPEHDQLFPYDYYSNEDEQSKWPLGAKVFEATDTTSASTNFPSPTKKLKAGWYKLVVTTIDKNGESVKAEKFIQLTDPSVNSTTEPIFFIADTKQAKPGDAVSYQLQTAFDNIFLLQQVSRMHEKKTYSFKTLTGSTPSTTHLKVTENDRGGIGYSYLFVKHNRVYQGTELINVPWENKDLSIKYETFRDKILPGSQEKWKVKISGTSADKIAAETLISMYDASLDQFKPHGWNSLASIWPSLVNYQYWNTNTFTFVNSEEYNRLSNQYLNLPEKTYDELLNNGWKNNLEYRGYLQGRVAGVAGASPTIAHNLESSRLEEVTVAGYGSDKKAPSKKNGERAKEQEEVGDTVKAAVFNKVQIRKNFNETAFFFPELLTDNKGNVEFSFTIPDALTTWKLMTLAHSKELSSGYSEQTVITQKPIMIQANAPRFVREADEMELSAKVSNLTEKEITGTAQLELIDIATGKPVDGWFKNVFPNQYFTAAAGQSMVVKFPIGIPVNFNSTLQYRIKAISKDGIFTDGEENAIPVLTNRMLVTETFPINMRNTNKKVFRFDKLKNSASSSSLTNHSLTVEYTSNPAWYAVQALPYLMEFPYECSEQTFNRFYANTLASYLSNSIPGIKAIFEKWKTTDTSALMSNLQKNEALKSALLEETPWLMQAKNEQEQKKNIALLFDMVRLSKEKLSNLKKLKELQTASGGFSWFKGGPEDRYITQYIVTGIGHLKQLKAISSDDYDVLIPIVQKALPYLDEQIKKDYDNLVRYKTDLKQNNLSSIEIHYLYMRSFFTGNDVSSKSKTAYDYYLSQSQKYWLSNSKYQQAMIALFLNRLKVKQTPAAIMKSLKENAIYSEEMGMYFKEFTSGGYYWHQAPIESQALVIEAFTEIDKNSQVVDDLKTWLLKQKQTQNWSTTKATADACYALLLGGSNWLAETKEVEIKLGNTIIQSSNDATQAGTGYFNKIIDAANVKPDMGDITVNITTANSATSTSTSWGAVYWQYFEDLDKITASANSNPLKLTKKLFIEKNTDKGPVLTEVKDGDALKAGDKIKVRLVISSDRDMEYIHLKDMRAACMEPVNVISSYKYQGGLGYYETTKDASTNFFFSWLPRGTYTFEYPMFVTHAGNYSTGISSIQCMYAPEFSSHTQGIRVNVE